MFANVAARVSFVVAKACEVSFNNVNDRSGSLPEIVFRKIELTDSRSR